MKSNTISTKSPKGFSIVEVAVAMGVVTLMLTTFLGIFGPAQKTVQRALSTRDASAMKDALSNELAILSQHQIDSLNVETSFEKAVQYITESHEEDTAVLVYRYKAVPESDTNQDGILEAFSDTGGIPGRDFIVQTAVRKIDIDNVEFMQDELTPEAVDGPVFVVRMTQLINDSNGDFSLSESENQLLDPIEGTVIDVADFDDAVIAFRAEFYKLPSNIFSFVTGGTWVLDELGSPVASGNIAIRR